MLIRAGAAMAAPEIGFDHRFVPHHRFGRAAGDDMALIEDQHALGQRHDHFHDVLDDDDGDAHFVNAPDQRDGLAQFGRRQAGERLVEQQEPRLGRQHAGDFEALSPGRAERARRLIRRASPVSSTMRRAWSRASLRCGWRRNAPTITLCSTLMSSNVVGTWKVRPMPARACASGEARVTSVPAKTIVPRGRHGFAGEAIEEGRFAGAVRADQADDLAFVHGQIGAARRRGSSPNALETFCGLKQHGRVSTIVAPRAATVRTGRPARSARSAR